MDKLKLEKARVLLGTVFERDELADVMSRLDPPKETAKRPDKHLTTREACRLAGVHRKTLGTWAKKGFLHPNRITPSRFRWSRNELETFLCETLGA